MTEQKGQTGICHSVDLLRNTQNCDHGYINEIHEKKCPVLVI